MGCPVASLWLGCCMVDIPRAVSCGDGFGGHAPKLYKDGRLADLATYCARDVIVTRDLYFKVLSRGHILTPEGLCVPVDIEKMKAKK